MILTLERLLKGFENAGLVRSQSKLPKSREAPVHYVVDSRKLNKGDWFIAYRGEQLDSHRFLSADLLAKAGGVIYEDEAYTELIDQHDLPAICVTDGRMAWAYAAAERYAHPEQDLVLIGVTGTNGKTSSTWMIKEMLALKGQHCLVIGTLGALFPGQTVDIGHTTPDSEQLFQLLAKAKGKGIRYVVMEVSSHAIVQSRLGPLRFHGAVFTSFSRDHLDFHGSMEDYFAAKWRLLTHYLQPNPKIAIAHQVLDAKVKYLPLAELPSQCITYGEQLKLEEKNLSASQLGYRLQSRDLNFAHIEVIKTSVGESQKSAKSIQSGELGMITEHGIENFLAAMIVVDSLIGQELSASQWPNVQPVPGRLEPVLHELKGRAKVFVDYAHTPDAIEQTLSTLRPLLVGRLWIVFGCGGERDPGKRPLMARAAEKYADAVVVTSDNPRKEDPAQIIEQVLAGFSSPNAVQHVEVDRRQAIRWCLSQAAEQDVVLIAGKGHETYQLIGERTEVFDDRMVAVDELKSLAQ